MLQALYDYFYNLFSYLEISNGDNLMQDYFFYIKDNNSGVISLSVGDYLAFICSIISLIIIVVLCCLFIYRLIRLVGRLFHG